MPRMPYDYADAEETYNSNNVSQRIGEASSKAGDYQTNTGADTTIKMVKGLLKEGDKRIRERAGGSY